MPSTIAFYVCAALSIGGALLATLSVGAGTRALRAAGLLAVAVGAAGMFALLSAVFAAVVELVAGGASALLIGMAPAVELPARRPSWPAQLAAVGCAGIFAVLAFAAWRGGLVAGSYPGGVFNSAAVARLLLDRDALAGVALGAMLLAGLAAAAASWRVRRR